MIRELKEDSLFPDNLDCSFTALTKISYVMI